MSDSDVGADSSKQVFRSMTDKEYDAFGLPRTIPNNRQISFFWQGTDQVWADAIKANSPTFRFYNSGNELRIFLYRPDTDVWVEIFLDDLKYFNLKGIILQLGRKIEECRRPAQVFEREGIEKYYVDGGIC
jgi:hypothetical protein